MSSTQEPPPPSSSSVRLFVGNLVPSITDVALVRLFSRFGETSDFERNAREGFAHLSVKPKTGSAPNDVERAVNSLNRTTWCGTTLRVERAREHYLDRLKREWAEERSDDGRDTEIEDSEPSSDHFVNARKGKHTRFSFPDAPFSNPGLENEMDEESDTIMVQNSHENTDELRRREADVIQAKASKNPTPTKSGRLDSTLALFGLSSFSERLVSATKRSPSASESSNDNKRNGQARERSPAKRPRRLQTFSSEHTDEANADPSVVDINSEKEAARLVLQKLFPESEATRPNLASCRRRGLYRELLQAPEDGQDYVNRFEVQLDVSMLDARPSRSGRPKGESAADADKFRKAGLYKMLLTEIL